MAMKLSHVFGESKRAFLGGARYISNAGGARSGKTYSTLQLLLCIAIYRNNTLITVTSENLPHLKKGAMRDFEKILNESGMEGAFIHNKSNNTYTCTLTRSSIEFVSFADSGCARGPQRDILFCNEINNMDKETCDQLFTRTAKTVFWDYNPVAQFWVNSEKENLDNCVRIHSTYKDNDFLSKVQIEEIESHKNNENWWRVYGLGLVGNLEGAVYDKWDQLPYEQFPQDDEKTYWGLDFGFTHDPTALVRVVKVGMDLYVSEHIYQKGLTNDKIAEKLANVGVRTYDRVVADSAEKKSIAEINNKGYHLEPVQKYPNSILEGIQILQGYNIHVAQESTNLIYELRNYTWEKDRLSGDWINRPIDCFNHLLDALRYVALTYLTEKEGYYESELGDL